jgi:uncharacterized spore protein YtfJ
MRHTPDLSRISESLAEAFGTREVFGEPIERDGAIVIPAARVWSGGGAGGGGGTEPGGTADAAPVEDPADPAGSGAEPGALAEGEGSGFGFGRRAEPAGAFVVDEHGVRWVPAVDVNRIVLGGQVAFVLAVAAVAWAVSRRRKR